MVKRYVMVRLPIEAQAGYKKKRDLMIKRVKSGPGKMLK